LKHKSSLTVTAEGLLIAADVIALAGREGLGGLHGTLLLHTTVLLARRSETAKLAMLVAALADPVDARIVADDLVEGVDHDDFVPLVERILRDPVGVEHAEVADTATDTGLGDGALVHNLLLLVDTGVLGLTVDLTLGGTTLAATTVNAHAEDGKALLLLESQAAGLVRARSVLATDDGGHLTVLPAADTKQETHHIALLLAPELGKVLVGAHLGYKTK